jgi:hypothetical protein
MDTNEHTGDSLINKPTNGNYRVGFDLIWGTKKEKDDGTSSVGVEEVQKDVYGRGS